MTPEKFPLKEADMPARKTLAVVVAIGLVAPLAGLGQGKNAAPPQEQSQTQNRYDFGKAQYIKRSAAGEKKGQTIDGTLRFDSASKEVQFFKKLDAPPEFTLKYDAIKSMLYEKTAKPRYAAGLILAWPLLFTKSKKHFLTIQYTDAAGTGQFAIIRLDKGNFREALARAESETGKKVERSEEH
jgi:hypothetical protein